MDNQTDQSANLPTTEILKAGYFRHRLIRCIKPGSYCLRLRATLRQWKLCVMQKQSLFREMQRNKCLM